jgi:exopolysaccharide biosynthesis polyprenyl glycosylphosphotransferase
MLRQFSLRRIIGFFLLDWLGTLAVLATSGLLHAQVQQLPPSLVAVTQALQITVGWAGDAAHSDALPPPVFILASLIWPSFFFSFSVYDGRRNQTLWAELRNVWMAQCVSTMTLAGILYFTYRETSRTLFLVFFALDLALLLGSRVALYARRRVQPRPSGSHGPAVLVIGAGPVGRDVVAQLRRYAWADMQLIGYLDDDPKKQVQEIEGLSVLGTLDQARQVVAARRVQYALVTLPLCAHERLTEICRTLQQMAVRVFVIPDLFALSFPDAALDGFGGIPVLNLGLPGVHGRRRLAKRVFDTAAVLIGLVLVAPLLVILAILIKLDSPGPVFYRQPRIGENGRPFVMLKFRSMRVNVSAALHQAHVARLIQENLIVEQLNGNGSGTLKLENDPRVTRIGNFIRKTSLDELPQLFNVLRGEMSLVGPRPPLAYEVELYKDWHKRRLEAIPGITGLWQVKGRNRVSFDEMVRMDLQYIRQQSFWLDLKILLQTPWAVITGRGAG